MELVGDFRSMDQIFKECYGDSFLYTCAELGQLRQRGIHLPPYRGEIPALPDPSASQAAQGNEVVPTKGHYSYPICLPRPNAPVAKAGPTTARDAAPTHQLQSAPTLLQPRSPPVPRSQPRMSRSLPGLMALTSVAVPPPCPLSQSSAQPAS